MSCPPGKILRDGYVRRDQSRVAATCVKDMGKPGKTPESQKIRASVSDDIDLGAFGYKHITDLKAEERHNALKKAINHVASSKKLSKHEAAVKVLRRINLIAILNKNTNVTTSQLMERDRNWISASYVRT